MSRGSFGLAEMLSNDPKPDLTEVDSQPTISPAMDHVLLRDEDPYANRTESSATRLGGVGSKKILTETDLTSPPPTRGAESAPADAE